VKEPMYKFIDIHDIEANEKQPRTHFEKEKIQELSVSIQQNGLLQPIVVRPYNGKYQIVVGERRFRACKLAGLEEVPCMVQEYNEDQTATAALVENIQRENLSPIEEALAYQQLLDTQDITQEQLAEKVGKKQSTIANKIRLLQLPQRVQDALKERQITERHARALLSLPDASMQVKTLKKVINKGLNVKQTEDLIQKDKKDKIKNAPKRGISQHIKLAINTVKQAVDMVGKTGIELNLDEQDLDEYYVMTIKIKKNR